MRKFQLVLAMSVLVVTTSSESAMANSHDISITNGKGEEITVKNGLNKSKKTVVKNRFGHKYEKKKTLFNRSSTQASAFGNSITKKDGLFGSSQTEVFTILGDKVKTKKGWFGRRKTTVEAGGLSSLVGQMVKTKSADR
ncbi:MAG: hypothetical protein K8F91_26835 [Candidatus Obscuribacterales bacterium]|nr:hypothetical protein [Candidatus Obscuribacterales bacterium]